MQNKVQPTSTFTLRDGRCLGVHVFYCTDFLGVFSFCVLRNVCYRNTVFYFIIGGGWVEEAPLCLQKYSCFFCIVLYEYALAVFFFFFLLLLVYVWYATQQVPASYFFSSGTEPLEMTVLQTHQEKGSIPAEQRQLECGAHNALFLCAALTGLVQVCSLDREGWTQHKKQCV